MESSGRLASSSPPTPTSSSSPPPPPPPPLSSPTSASSSSSCSPPAVVAVLGATGFLGRLLVREAAQAGYAVRAVVRPSADPRRVAELSRARNVSVVRCETVPSAAAPGAPSSAPGSSLAAALAGCSAVLCALAGRGNAGGAEGVARMRSVEVDGIVACFEAFLESAPPRNCSPETFTRRRRRRFVAFAPPVRQLTRNGTRRPLSEYVRAKEEMEQRLRLAAEAAFKAEAERGEEAAKRRGAGAEAAPPSSPSPAVAVAVAVSVFEVAAWGRDSAPIAAALLRSRASLVVSGGRNRLQPLDEGDLARRVVRGLSLQGDASAGPGGAAPFTVVSVGGPRVLTWRELVADAGRRVGVEPVFVSVPRWALEKVLVPAAELASRSSTRLSRAGYLARLAADVMATDLVAEEAVGGGGGGGGGVEAKL